MERMRRTLLVAGLVGSPAALLVYWLIYPAYGDVSSGAIAERIAADPDAARLADVFGFAAAFLAVPASLGYLAVLTRRSPRLAGFGAALSITGWTALVGVLMLDVFAAELANRPGGAEIFEAVYENGLVLGLNSLVALHVVGSMIFGVALLRTGLVPKPVGAVAIVLPLIHVAANVGGLLWLDTLTWVVFTGLGVVVAKELLSDK